MSTQPTDEEIDAVTLEVLGYAALDKNTNETARLIARAVLAKWGSPVVAGPVAWRYRMKGDLQWQYTERPEQFAHADEVQPLTTPQPTQAQAGAVQLERFLDAAASEGLVLDGIDAADLYVLLFPELYAQGMEGVPIKEGGQHGTE